MKTIVVVGQTPPPFGGQAIMIQLLLQSEFEGLRLVHVRMAFSKSFGELGRFNPAKVLHAFSVIFRIAWARLRYGASALYFPPSGPSFLPVVRDVVILIATRWMFRSTIFHFHAAGISEIYDRLPSVLRAPFRWAFFGANLAIQTSELNPPDGGKLKANRVVVVANGLPDEARCGAKSIECGGKAIRLLYVGLISESKGAMILIESLARVRNLGIDAELTMVGEFISAEFRDVVNAFVEAQGLVDVVGFPGVLSGRSKSDAYSAADIFCYPTFFEAESFGLVVVEAMQFGLPVVASKWRGVASVIEDGVEGLLVAPRNVESLAASIAALARNPADRFRLGESGRAKYERLYSVDRFRVAMETCLSSVCGEIP